MKRTHYFIIILLVLCLTLAGCKKAPSNREDDRESIPPQEQIDPANTENSDNTETPDDTQTSDNTEDPGNSEELGNEEDPNVGLDESGDLVIVIDEDEEVGSI